MNTEQVITDIMRREGGFVDDPADRGGATNYGITRATLSAWRGKPVTADDVRSMSEGEARDIYRAEYVTKPGFDRVNGEKLQALLVDCGVNHGPGNAVKLLQRALGLKDDGAFGPKTRDALYNADPGATYRKVVAERVKFYGRIITNDPTQAKFAAGWMARAAEFIAA